MRFFSPCIADVFGCIDKVLLCGIPCLSILTTPFRSHPVCTFPTMLSVPNPCPQLLILVPHHFFPCFPCTNNPPAPIRTHRRSTLIIFVSPCLLVPMWQNREISRPRVPQSTRISVLLYPLVPHFRVPPYASEPFHLSAPTCTHLRPSMSIPTPLLSVCHVLSHLY